MAEIETVRSIVNTWECDENAHLNVQFYFAHFDTAGRQFLAQSGLGQQALGPRKVRHVRYHKEMRAAELVQVVSAVVPDGPHPVTIAHRMLDPLTGRLAATALDGYGAETGRAIDIDALPAIDMPSEVLPRSFDAAPRHSAPDTASQLAAGGAVTYRGALHPRHGDVAGTAIDQSYISCVTDGAAHAWEHGGLTARWLAENGFGRVAVEMKLSYLAPMKAGDLVHMVTVYTGATSKAFTFNHTLFDTESGRPLAVAETAGLAMDLATRRAVLLPEEIRSGIEKMAAAANAL